MAEYEVIWNGSATDPDRGLLTMPVHSARQAEPEPVVRRRENNAWISAVKAALQDAQWHSLRQLADAVGATTDGEMACVSSAVMALVRRKWAEQTVFQVKTNGARQRKFYRRRQA